MNTPLIRVIVADDHPIIHQGIEKILFATRTIVLVDIATNFATLLDKLAATQADVVVLDLNSMGEAPLVMVRVLRQRFPETQLLIFSSSITMAQDLIAEGALGYVAKQELQTHLPAAIQMVATGQPYVSPLVEEHLERAGNGRNAVLLPQEERVLKLVAEGLTTRDIAANLGIDPRTAQNYISTLYQKTGCETRGQLMLLYNGRYGEAA
jgi:DNA-binding NarL/FixJ family response regulator